jgi:hypothetical protein
MRAAGFLCLAILAGSCGGSGTPPAGDDAAATDAAEVADAPKELEVIDGVVFDHAETLDTLPPDGLDDVTDATDPGTDGLDDADAATPGGFMWPCANPSECLSSYCIEMMSGFFCTKTCQTEATCPKAWKCVKMGGDIDPVYVCVDPFVKLCQPCKVDQDCKDPNSTSKNLCIEEGPDAMTCGTGCEDSAGCPEGFACVEVGAGRDMVKQCRREDGSACECSQKHKDAAYLTTCYVEKDLGLGGAPARCYGERTCDEACDAKTPKVEECNLEDDDCNGKVDDNVPPQPCPLTVGPNTCTGHTVCISGNVQCQGTGPTDETCNGKDDDCDGATDEGFLDTDNDKIADCVDCDIDGDGVANPNPGCDTPVKPDNCPTIANLDQADTDADKIGDACDCDMDGDGVMNNNPGCPVILTPDNCTYVVNKDQKDTDGDEIGDACDCDIDGDGVANAGPDANGGWCPVPANPDNCTYVKNPGQEDTNGNGKGDACDCDADDDGVDNNGTGCPIILDPDNCPTVKNPGQEDRDNDGIGDACDCDIDGDGVTNDNPTCGPGQGDNCPFVANPLQTDTNLDGTGDACDCDIDGDGVFNPNPGCPACAPQCDNCEYTVNPDQANTTGSPFGDACNLDWDNDGVPNDDDNCPRVPNGNQEDMDLDGEGDACDCDIDGDGLFNDGPTQDGGVCPTPDPRDNCPWVFNPDLADLDLDGIGDACDCDIDGDLDPNPNPGCETPVVPDCQPYDPMVFHGQAEVCNGIDDDCDGLVDALDSGAIVNGFFLADQPKCGNQKGVCAGSRRPAALCVGGGWEECGDPEFALWASVLYNPGHETLCDGLDNDCDGAADEDFTLSQPDGTMVIGVGVPCGVGECAKTGGKTACTDAKTGIWCPAQLGATKELCDGKDNDCDGKVDAADADSIVGGFFEADRPACENQEGVCQGTAHPAALCQGGAWTACTDAVYAAQAPAYEAGQETGGAAHCDALDNDCDGATDEDFSLVLLDGTTVWGVGTACGTGKCAGGTTSCRTDRKAIECPFELKATAEKCGGGDDDCDGFTDAADLNDIDAGGFFVNDGGVLCEKTTGVCLGSKKPASLCQGGTWTACTDATYGAYSQYYDPNQTEARCDSRDNDCDGLVDEDLGATTCGKGVCLHTVQNCIGGQVQVCDPMQGKGPEICNGKDDDCDGAVDNGVTQACYTGPSGTENVGICHGGTSTCSGGTWGACVGQVTPQAEKCNGLDDDCDTFTDAADLDSQTNGYFNAEQPDCSNQQGVCLGAKKKAVHCVSGSWQACTDLEYAANSVYYEAAPEKTCDNRDNDCDSSIDESITKACYDGPTGTNGVGACHGGTSTCSAGGWGACAGQVMPVNETCNKVDDDCDGTTDAADYPDPTNSYFPSEQPNCENQAGVCNGTKKTVNLCQNGVWAACDTARYQKVSTYQVHPESLCDGLDNDCDSAIDNDVTYTQLNGAVVTGISKPCGTGRCANGTTVCNAGTKQLYCPTEVIPGPVSETCDGSDQDCDGTVDDGGSDWCNAQRPAGFHGTAACSSGACVIASCDATWFNVNTTYADGCECQQDNLDIQGQATSCASAYVVTIPDDALSTTTITGNIVPVNEEDWFKFVAVNNAQTGSWGSPGNEGWKPRVWFDTLATDPCVRFVVQSNCSGSLHTCGSGTNTNLQTFEQKSDTLRPCVNWSQWDCVPGDTCCESDGSPLGTCRPSLCLGSSQVLFYVKVFRMTSGACATAPQCAGTAYKMYISNGY